MRLIGKYRPAQGGHAPGHLTEAFALAVDEFEAWNVGKPEPTVRVGYDEVRVPITRIFAWLSNCTDILSSRLLNQIDDERSMGTGVLRRHTVGAAARYMLERVKASSVTVPA